MISFPEILLRLVVAIALGAAVGVEREIHEHSAGMRTIALVTLGCALFTIASAYGFLALLNLPHVSLDPTRIASYIVAGIGFLGAGTIFMSREGERIRGLTTAATIWVMAAIGIACGTGMLVEALVTTALVLVVLEVFRLVEIAFLPRKDPNRQHIKVEAEEITGQLIASIYEACASAQVTVEKLQINATQDKTSIELLCYADSTEALGKAIGTLHGIAGLRAVHTLPHMETRELAAKVNRERKGR